jgi:hypothetical protein
MQAACAATTFPLHSRQLTGAVAMQQLTAAAVLSAEHPEVSRQI